MTSKQREAYAAAAKALAGNHKAEQEKALATFAHSLEELATNQKRVLRQLELAHQREWFALRARFKFDIGPAGRAILQGGGHAHGL